jgi:hypothetical protein
LIQESRSFLDIETCLRSYAGRAKNQVAVPRKPTHSHLVHARFLPWNQIQQPARYEQQYHFESVVGPTDPLSHCAYNKLVACCLLSNAVVPDSWSTTNGKDARVCQLGFTSHYPGLHQGCWTIVFNRAVQLASLSCANQPGQSEGLSLLRYRTIQKASENHIPCKPEERSPSSVFCSFLVRQPCMLFPSRNIQQSFPL